MRGIVKLASALIGRRGRSGMGQQQASAAAMATASGAALIVCIALAHAPARAAVPPPAVPPAGQPGTAPNVVAPGAPGGAGATAPATQPGGPLVISGLDERTGTVRLLVNKSVTLETSRPYTRVNVGQPDVADANGIGATRILVT